jgi:hypothetical protein
MSPLSCSRALAELVREQAEVAAACGAAEGGGAPSAELAALRAEAAVNVEGREREGFVHWRPSKSPQSAQKPRPIQLRP